jgi:short-subunit dehydrogenase
MEIKGSVVIVTGASRGIGLATARLLSSRAARVVLSARSADRLLKLEGEIPNSIALPCDMSKAEDIHHLILEAKKRCGRIDILINNAGQGMRTPVEAIDINDYRAVIDLNVIGPLRAMQEVIPFMRQQGRGMILNISSLTSKHYFPMIAAYSSTKYALNALSLTARQELGKDGIVVSVFHPKITATDFGDYARGQTYSSRAGVPGMMVDTPEAVAEQIARQIETEEPEIEAVGGLYGRS